MFNRGSTVPLKFQLRNAAGVPVAGAVAEWLAPAKGIPSTENVDERLYYPAAR